MAVGGANVWWNVKGSSIFLHSHPESLRECTSLVLRELVVRVTRISVVMNGCVQKFILYSLASVLSCFEGPNWVELVLAVEFMAGIPNLGGQFDFSLAVGAHLVHEGELVATFIVLRHIFHLSALILVGQPCQKMRLKSPMPVRGRLGGVDAMGRHRHSDRAYNAQNLTSASASLPVLVENREKGWELGLKAGVHLRHVLIGHSLAEASTASRSGRHAEKDLEPKIRIGMGIV